MREVGRNTGTEAVVPFPKEAMSDDSVCRTAQKNSAADYKPVGV